jgi:glycosyltransferase involved in cell wall biosynthesis
MNDLVSIVMPSYNTGKYIAESIQSVLAQTYKNWELIIVDDCSTDDTDAVLKQFCDPRIRYFKNETNSGAAVSRNRALREAKGRWIAFLDSDDLWHPEKLQKQIGFMEEKGYAFSYTNYSEIGEDSVPLGVLVTGPKRITKADMYAYCWPGCLTVMYDADLVGLVQIADIKKNNDYAMWLQICHKADCYLLDEELGAYRKRSGSISRHGYMTLIQWHYKLFREALAKGPVRSLLYTALNLAGGLWKKLRYVKKYLNEHASGRKTSS